MIAQTSLPYAFPFSPFDFGVAAIALVLMGLMTYLFISLAKQQHKASTEVLRDLLETSQSLVVLSREIVASVERTREEVWRNRQLLDRILEIEGR